MTEIMLAVILLVTMVLGYLSVKKGWKIADFF